MRIQKLIASLGLCSRRKAEELIQQGRVKVNNKVAVIGDKIAENDALMVDGKKVKFTFQAESSARLLLINKPLGVMCSHKAQTSHQLIYDLLPKIPKGKWMTIGRLDLNSQGLLLVTNNGDILQKLLHPKQALERVYKVRIRGLISEKEIKSLLTGITIEGHACKFHKLEPISQGKSNSTWHVTLYEGRNREIRSMFAQVGAQVNSLKRIKYGPFKLPADLPPGKWYDIPIDVLDAKL